MSAKNAKEKIRMRVTACMVRDTMLKHLHVLNLDMINSNLLTKVKGSIAKEYFAKIITENNSSTPMH